MEIKLNQEQLSHLKSLDSKKKKRKFLLDCMLENIDLEISNFFSKDYIKNESQEIIDKSNEPQPPMNFCVEIDSHNRGVLETAYTGFSTGKPVHFRAKYLHSNSLNTYMSTSDLIQESLLVTTNEFLTYIGRKDLIERKSVKISDLPVVENCEICHMYPKIENSNKCVSCYSCIKHIIENDAIFENYRPKKQVEEKVDLSKELYLTYDNGEKKSSAVRVLDYENGFGFGFIDGSYFDYSENRINYNFRFKDGFWRKSTALEVTNMLIDKLKLDGFYVGCNIDNTSILDNGRVYVTKENYFLYKDFDMLLCGSVIIYNNGKFATIIPQEEVKIKTEQGDAVAKEEEAVKLTLNDGTVIWKTKWDILQEPKAENHELVNSSDEIKDIIVVDFENVSQKENPQ